MAAQWKPGDLALLLCSDGQWRLGFYSLRTGASNSARRDELTTQGRRDGLVNEARMEVKAAVEEWFSNVSLDDLFRTKGWS